MRADPEADADFFTAALARLEAAGYLQYEISNYARPGYVSVHNQSYWAGNNYLGIGPSAFSTIELGGGKMSPTTAPTPTLCSPEDRSLDQLKR